MFFEVNDKEPIYIQIIKHIKISIITKVLNPGDEVPSRRELAEILRVNPNTVQRAYREMEMSGLIETVRNFPSKITADNEVLNSIKDELVNEAIETFLTSMKELKFSKNDILNLIENRY